MASDFSIRHAAHIISHGGIIAYPTETVYGLGCDIYNAAAVEKINLIKQRPRNKQFILLAGNIDQIKPLIKISDEEESIIKSTTVPTSWIIDASPNAPEWLTDNNNTLTIRISTSHLVKKLCHILGHAIISTSANISGKKPAKTSLDLHMAFHNKVHKILASSNELSGKPSKIIQLCNNRVIRH